MYADSEMSFFGRENLRNSAFQRGKTFFIYLFKRNSSAPCDKMCNSQKILTRPPQKGFFLRPATSNPVEIPLSVLHFFKFFGLTEPPIPQEITVFLLSGEYGYFQKFIQSYLYCTKLSIELADYLESSFNMTRGGGDEDIEGGSKNFWARRGALKFLLPKGERGS